MKAWQSESAILVMSCHLRYLWDALKEQAFLLYLIGGMKRHVSTCAYFINHGCCKVHISTKATMSLDDYICPCWANCAIHQSEDCRGVLANRVAHYESRWASWEQHVLLDECSFMLDLILQIIAALHAHEILAGQSITFPPPPRAAKF